MSTDPLPLALAAPPGGAEVTMAPIAHDLGALTARLDAAGVAWRTDDGSLDDHARDWWPVSIGWAAHGVLYARPSVVVAPRSTDEVASAVEACARAAMPVTIQGGRSGVCGGAVPEPGGVALDLTGCDEVLHFDEASLRVRVGAGLSGPALEAFLRARGCTVGHFPQSFELATVGGWVACRGAGQYSTRYGKIEDLVRGLTVVLADGTVVTTGGRGPREAAGPDLTQLFVGAEGTLGVVTEVELVVHRVPAAEARRAWSFDSFTDGLEACRRVLQRGATPAVLRLYDERESERSFGLARCALVVLDEADPALLDATLAIVDAECAAATREDDALVATWLEHRNDVSALGALWQRGVVVDTLETAAPWSALDRVHREVTAAILGVESTVVASVHQSHAYLDGACLYFTFAGRPPEDQVDGYYRAVWTAATAAALGAGASLSHHHGVGRHRAGYVASALGTATGVLDAVKDALDPEHRLNPSVLGFALRRDR
ncbi:MAG TPA: FAD-binding oxidoreductase [Acidimicrobiales bacterium]|nr:FAD-binding oxidoreductase [Acidimicrobiales bacterium]